MLFGALIFTKISSLKHCSGKEQMRNREGGKTISYSVILYYTTLHYTALHYTPSHYTTLPSTPPHHSTPLPLLTLHYTTPHSPALSHTTLHNIHTYQSCHPPRPSVPRDQHRVFIHQVQQEVRNTRTRTARTVMKMSKYVCSN